MDEIVDHALYTYGLTRELDATRIAQSREKIIRYIDKLGAARTKRHASVGHLCAGVPERIARGARPTVHRLLVAAIWSAKSALCGGHYADEE